MLPNFGYRGQIMHTDIKKQGLPQMSANRPSIWFAGMIYSYVLFSPAAEDAPTAAAAAAAGG